jgi:hypothetical protein
VTATRTVEEANAYPCLIVCPGYLVDQWHDHLRAEGHPADSVVVAATVATRDDPKHPERPPSLRSVPPEEKQALLNAARSPAVRWLIVNYEVMRQPPAEREKSVERIWAETAAEKGWLLPGQKDPRPKRHMPRYKIPPMRAVICDEAHRLRGRGERGRGSQQFRGCYQIASRHHTELVLPLTATPIYRDVGDLFFQLRLLDSRRFTSYWDFIQQYAILDEDEWGTHIVGYRPAAQALLSQYAIRREYTDPEVQLDIPPLISRQIYVTMTPDSAKQYAQVKYQHRARDGSLIMDSGTALTELRAVTAHDKNKLDALANLTLDLDRSYIVFTHYRETAKAVSALLQAPLVIGGQKGNAAIARSSQRLVANIDALQEGLDLSHLRAVIFYEPDYLPGKHKQAMMRVQRWRPSGDQTTPVLLYWLIARGTIDRHVYTVAHDRGADADQLMRMEMQPWQEVLDA